MITDNAKVYESALRPGEPIARLARNADIRVSSAAERDAQEVLWYKTRLPDGTAAVSYGYIRSNDIVTEDRAEDLKARGVDLFAPPPVVIRDPNWSFVLRGMGLGGYRTVANKGIVGGEAEASVVIPLEPEGYGHREFSLGVAHQQLGDTSANLASLIYRIFSGERSEPEVRFRAGKEAGTGVTLLGLNAGVRYPFALNEAQHLAGYFEVGGLYANVARNAPLRLWAAAGLGLHF